MSGIGEVTAGAEPFEPAFEVPVLSRSAHDRIAHRRDDQEWVAAAWLRPSTRVLLLGADATTPSASGTQLDLCSVAEVELSDSVDRVLLGEAGSTAYFALIGRPAREGEPHPAATDGRPWRGLRELATELSDLDVGLLTTAVALQAWHVRHPRCPQCGAPTETAKAGWTRICSRDGSEHFPRTDPAVIMLVRDSEDRCLLARGPLWPPGRMSVLAGFVEAGESAEAAVVREVGEEVGIAVGNVRYVASQPHPFPASLMLGFTAEVVGDSALRPDNDEILDAGWFSREEVRRAAEWGAEDSPALAGAMLRGLPPRMSIARQLIDAWLSKDPIV